MTDKPEVGGTDSDDEAVVSRYLEAYGEQGKPGVRYVVQHPQASWAALRALRRLPRLIALLSPSLEGQAIGRGLRRPSPIGRTLVHAATAVLVLPDEPNAYQEGASKQTLRRKVRAARKLGVHWRAVDDPLERRRLLEIANQHERDHPLEQYRQTNPDNMDLLATRLWLVAYSSADEPLLLSVTPIDGEWALLRYFRTFGSGDPQSNARYLMTGVLAEHLVEAGVRYLADEVSPVGLANGIRHFQRMMGFRIFLVDLPRSERRTTMRERAVRSAGGAPVGLAAGEPQHPVDAAVDHESRTFSS